MQDITKPSQTRGRVQASTFYLYGQTLQVDLSMRHELSRIFGLGLKRAQFIVREKGWGDLSKLRLIGRTRYSRTIDNLAYYIRDRYLIDIELEYVLLEARRWLRRSGQRRAIRFDKGLPIRGQRTRTNGRTAKTARRDR